MKTTLEMWASSASKAKLEQQITEVLEDNYSNIDRDRNSITPINRETIGKSVNIYRVTITIEQVEPAATWATCPICKMDFQISEDGKFFTHKPAIGLSVCPGSGKPAI